MSDYWKDLERRHATRFFNGTRILRGNNFSQSLPDGDSATDVWDAKARASIAAIRWYREGFSRYKHLLGGRRWHIVLHEKGTPGDYVLLDANDYAELVRAAGRNDFLDELRA